MISFVLNMGASYTRWNWTSVLSKIKLFRLLLAFRLLDDSAYHPLHSVESPVALVLMLMGTVNPVPHISVGIPLQRGFDLPCSCPVFLGMGLQKTVTYEGRSSKGMKRRPPTCAYIPGSRKCADPYPPKPYGEGLGCSGASHTNYIVTTSLPLLSSYQHLVRLEELRPELYLQAELKRGLQ